MNAKIVSGAVVAVIAIAAGGVLWYLNRPAAEEASIDNALTALDEGTEVEEGPTADAAAIATDPTATEPTTAADPVSEAAPATGAPLDDVTGTWAVDTTIGEFDFADATATFAGFRVDEELSTVGETEAVGRTPALTGELQIDGTTLTDATIEADLTQMVSDVPRRDDAMMRAMGVAEFPTGTFTLTEAVDFGAIPAAGETITFDAAGDLTVNGTTVPTTFAMEAQVARGSILVVGRAPVVFADFGIDAPQAGPVVSIDDEGTVELQVWFSPAA